MTPYTSNNSFPPNNNFQKDSYQGNQFPDDSGDYNPEEEPETWDRDASWDDPTGDLETPESPPLFEKEGYNDPIEYHDRPSHGSSGDVDHRILPSLLKEVPIEMETPPRKKDIDHRNLISLTGSPHDQDYRMKTGPGSADKDYRIPFNLANLKLPPPPPPPNSSLETKPKKPGNSPRKVQDNVESIDMELSDDESALDTSAAQIHSNDSSLLEPPPPLPDLPDDIDANNFLDDLSNDLNTSEFLDENEGENDGYLEQPPLGFPAGFENPHVPMWNNIPPPPNMPPGLLHQNVEMIPPNMDVNAPNMHMMPPPMRMNHWNEDGFGFKGRGRGNFNPRGRGEIRGRGWNNRGFRGARGHHRGGREGNWNARGRGFNRGNPRAGF